MRVRKSVPRGLGPKAKEEVRKAAEEVQRAVYRGRSLREILLQELGEIDRAMGPAFADALILQVTQAVKLWLMDTEHECREAGLGDEMDTIHHLLERVRAELES